ncbi:hypothetical protein PIB30_002723 [Stylosanthes scabra]|uniref:Uncharacterized protein n=1 Tax=Stylosanthes scabra TaxID=79078 RepID=A0ABU6R390_9FABA|nr:hypothetical protein [Stylosanthes scabra]
MSPWSPFGVVTYPSLILIHSALFPRCHLEDESIPRCLGRYSAIQDAWLQSSIRYLIPASSSNDFWDWWNSSMMIKVLKIGPDWPVEPDGPRLGALCSSVVYQKSKISTGKKSLNRPGTGLSGRTMTQPLSVPRL